MQELNANPSIAPTEDDDSCHVVRVPAHNGNHRDPFTAAEVFDHIRRVRDPEHETLTLEQLRVTTMENVTVDEDGDMPTVTVRYTPTIPHCSMATLIGLCLSVKLLRSLPSRFKQTVMITEGTHSSEHEINRQLADKERVAAALENPHLLKVVNKCISATSHDDLTYAHDNLRTTTS
ncbi:hypothetical protein CTAYLR_002823 [Chrysophaeum taylorii]|uniref:MIP18 family-like domain-containing protein n=1 Tax=Chrysophaeum taylorii TaxID=2483200 RepID=A0AAD7UAD3_9STRA|nr:hypothetical protein CTAYLR_002823 [Chrysophaeum taylorii]